MSNMSFGGGIGGFFAEAKNGMRERGKIFVDILSCKQQKERRRGERKRLRVSTDSIVIVRYGVSIVSQ